MDASQSNDNIKLTKYVDIRGYGYKLPEDEISDLLSSLQLPKNRTMGVACSIVCLDHEYMIQTTNYMYSVIDDPYLMGKIGCANVLSNLYASGVTECDAIAVTLGISVKLNSADRLTVCSLITRGFKDCASESGAALVDACIEINRWFIVGGTATVICRPDDCIPSYKATAGDVLILTKPLGTHVAINVKSWMDNEERWALASNIITKEEAEQAYQIALESMSHLNQLAAKCMKKYDVHAVTDVGGYGLLGHAKMLVENQNKQVSFVIHNLPIIEKLAAVSKAFGNMFQLLEGNCPEISGGLLICMSRKHAPLYVQDMQSEGAQAWIIGTVEKEDRIARLIAKPRIIEVSDRSFSTTGLKKEREI